MAAKIFNRARFSRKRQVLKVLETLSYFLFVAAAIFVYKDISAAVFWITILLFGSGGVLAVRELLYPESELIYQKQAQAALDKQNDPGSFTYDEQGFTGIGTTGKFYCRWSEIEVLFAYKEVLIEERFASEETILNLVTSEHQTFRLNTSMPGWPQFQIRLQAHFPELPPNWVETIALPAFHTNATLLYDRLGRSQAQIEQLYYADGFDR